MSETFRTRCQDWLERHGAVTEEYELISGLVDTIDEIARAFHDGSSPNGWDISIMEEAAAIILGAGFAGVGPGFVDPNEWCWDGDHVGPVSVIGSEPIDNGIGLMLECETCKRRSTSSIDLDELEW